MHSALVFKKDEEVRSQSYFISCSYLAVMYIIIFRLRCLSRSRWKLPTDKALCHAKIKYQHLGYTPDAESTRGCAADYENHPWKEVLYPPQKEANRPLPTSSSKDSIYPNASVSVPGKIVASAIQKVTKNYPISASFTLSSTIL